MSLLGACALAWARLLLLLLLEQGLHLHGLLYLALPPACHVLTELRKVMDLLDFLLAHGLEVLVVFLYI